VKEYQGREREISDARNAVGKHRGAETSSTEVPLTRKRK